MSDETRGRQLLPGQTSRVHVYDVGSRTARLVFESATVLVEAPNVLDADTLVLNGDGDLWLLRLPSADSGTVLDETALVPVPMDGVDEINNDHVLDPSSTSIVVSARDGELYRVPLPDGGPATRITDVAAALPTKRKFYLHGIAPDGSALAAIVGSCPRAASGRPTSRWSTPQPVSRRSSRGTSTPTTAARSPPTARCSGTPSASHRGPRSSRHSGPAPTTACGSRTTSG
ncbi:hypothetical protein Q9Q99_06730 [Curtobacterium flaccumfaciens]|nr:hypothetical protein Q9Q99_06730 [Curtobacterium flaccumfaciens]